MRARAHVCVILKTWCSLLDDAIAYIALYIYFPFHTHTHTHTYIYILRHIETYRQKARQLNKTLKTANGATAAKLTEKLATVTARLGCLLDSTAGYYRSLLRRLLQRYGIYDIGLAEKPSRSSTLTSGNSHALASLSPSPSPSRRKERKHAIACCHSSLVFLGDVARYAATAQRPRRPDYTAAITYYTQALLLVPQIGNPYNQLAILATYAKDYCGAAAHYVRAMYAKQPGANAQANLARLLEQVAAASGRDDGEATAAASGAETAGTAEVLQQLLRLHAVAGTSKERPSTTSFGARRATWYGALTRLLCNYKSHTKDLHPGVLLQLVCLAIHTVRLSRTHEAPSRRGGSLPPGMSELYPGQQLLLDLLFSFTQATRSLQNRSTLPDIYGCIKLLCTYHLSLPPPSSSAAFSSSASSPLTAMRVLLS